MGFITSAIQQTRNIADKAITRAKLADEVKPSAGAAAGSEALRAIGLGAGEVAAGTHSAQHAWDGADRVRQGPWVLLSRPSGAGAVNLPSNQVVGYPWTYVDRGTSSMWSSTSPANINFPQTGLYIASYTLVGSNLDSLVSASFSIASWYFIGTGPYGTPGGTEEANTISGTVLLVIDTVGAVTLDIFNAAATAASSTFGRCAIAKIGDFA